MGTAASTELGARRERDTLAGKYGAAHDYAEASRWRWLVVEDPSGALVNPPPLGASGGLR